MRQCTVISLGSVLLAALASVGCGDAVVTGAFVDSDKLPIDGLTVDCGDRKVVTDLEGAFTCEYSSGAEPAMVVNWRDAHTVIRADELSGDLDLGTLSLVETAPTIARDEDDVVLQWPEPDSPGIQPYQVAIGTEPLWSEPAFRFLAEEPSLRIPAVALEDWELLVQVETRIEREEFRVVTLGASTPLLGTTPPLSRGASCQWSYLDEDGVTVQRAQAEQECQFTDGLLDPPAEQRIVEVTIDLGGLRSVSHVVVHDQIASWLPISETANWVSFAVSVGSTETSYRPVQRIEGTAINVYKHTGYAGVRFVRLRSLYNPALRAPLAELSVF